jgi:hypothetical protein
MVDLVTNPRLSGQSRSLGIKREDFCVISPAWGGL